MSICSIYLPPNNEIDEQEIDNLITQLPSPHLLLGDFNAHSKLWGCSQNSRRGNIIEDVIDKHDLCYLNDKTATHVCVASKSTSAIDLSLCHPSLYLDFNWEVGEDLCGSDHYPIFLQHTLTKVSNTNPRWKLHRADWETFQALFLERITSTKFLDEKDPIEAFSSTLIRIAEESIPRSSGKPKRPYFSWFNQDCRDSIRKRRKAFNTFKSPLHKKII